MSIPVDRESSFYIPSDSSSVVPSRTESPQVPAEVVKKTLTNTERFNLEMAQRDARRLRQPSAREMAEIDLLCARLAKSPTPQEQANIDRMVAIIRKNPQRFL